MAAQIKQFEQLANAWEQMQLPKRVTYRAGAKVDICAVWKTIKPFIEIAIKLLNLLPFKWAKKIADVLQMLADALNASCKT